MAKSSYKFFSVSPEYEDKIDKTLAGYHACLRKVNFNPNESTEWQEGWTRAKQGRGLTTTELRYMFR